MYIRSPARFELTLPVTFAIKQWLLGFRPTKLSREYIQGTTIVGIRLVFVYHRFFINEGSSDKRLPRKQEKYNFWITDFNAIYYCPIARRARLSSNYTYYAKHQPRDSMGFEPMSFNKVYRKYVNLLTCTY